MTAARLDALCGREVLVTGAGGLLGAAVVRRLVGLGARVRAWLGPAAAPQLQRPPPGVRIAYVDLAERGLRDAIDRELEGVSWVYHLAGPPSVAASFEDPAAYLRIHACATAGLLERCIAPSAPWSEAARTASRFARSRAYDSHDITRS